MSFMDKATELGSEAVQWQLKHHKLEAAMAAMDFVGDLRHRQPSEAKLRKMVKGMRDEIDSIEGVIASLSREITVQTAQGAPQRRRLRKRAHQALVLKYGFADSVDIVFDRIEHGTNLSYSEVDFLLAYGNFLAGRKVGKRMLESVERIVVARHGEEVLQMRNCNVKRSIDMIRGFELE